MKLAFSGKGRYPDMKDGYALYLKRVKKESPLDDVRYSRIVKRYCSRLADRLCEDGFVELPNGMGTISSAIITRKPQYRGDKFVGFGGRNFSDGTFDGKLKTFGIVYLARHRKNKDNLRCFGYVANRRLFQKMKDIYTNGFKKWIPLNFNDEMI